MNSKHFVIWAGNGSLAQLLLCLILRFHLQHCSAPPGPDLRRDGAHPHLHRDRAPAAPAHSQGSSQDSSPLQNQAYCIWAIKSIQAEAPFKTHTSVHHHLNKFCLSLFQQLLAIAGLAFTVRKAADCPACCWHPEGRAQQGTREHLISSLRRLVVERCRNEAGSSGRGNQTGSWEKERRKIIRREGAVKV